MDELTIKREFDMPDIIDDLWRIIFHFLNVQDFMQVKQSCKHFKDLTNNDKHPRIKEYWKLQCRSLCSDVRNESMQHI